jgi:TRAP-type C4-dicarboxylate transport system permease small subunit
MHGSAEQVRDRGDLMQGLLAAANAVAGAVHWVLGLAMLAIVAINVANATGRYLLGFSMTGADEVMVYTMVWMVMAGAVLSLASRDHISINLVPSYATGRTLHLLHIAHDLAAAFSCALATYASYGFVTKIAAFGTRSMGLGLPMVIPHAALLAGFAALTLTAVALLVRDADAWVRDTPVGEASQ